ncbi:hypothetical protein ECC46_07115 [Helicobacter pylori]|nr:hypothetical protein ECC46_07115 [Helicobacter pylori]
MIKGEIAVSPIRAETKAPIGVVCKARRDHIDARATEIHVRVLRPCIAVIKASLIDSDMVSRIKIESGPTASRI